MQVLILGGTAWLGRHLAEAAQARGHDVTCLARAITAAASPGVRLVKADRDRADAYDTVIDQRWDAVIDVARQPGHARRAAQALAPHCGVFAYVSTINVYADERALNQDEAAPKLAPLDADVMEGPTQYGSAKVASEQHVLHAVGAARAFIVRSGLIGGPGDVSGRSGYWPLRFARAAARGTAVLVPDTPSMLTQLIDVRDIAAWIVDAACRGQAGIFNAVGRSTRFDALMRLAQQVAGHGGPMVNATPDWLAAQGVTPWMGPRSLPMWAPGPENAGLGARSHAAALSAGLLLRPLGETLRDTLHWELTREPDAPRRAGMSDADEAALLVTLGA